MDEGLRLSTLFDKAVTCSLDGAAPPRPEWSTLHGDRSRPLKPLPARPHAPEADGPRELRHPNGRLARAWHISRGVLHGPYSEWTEPGQVCLEAEWLEGRPHADFERWWPCGIPMVRGSFSHGKPVGTWTITNAEGIVLYSGPWRGTLRSWLPAPFADAVVPPKRPLSGR